jgi:ribosomal protein S6
VPAACEGSGRKENQMARLYEVMFVVRPDVLDEELDKLIAGFEGTVTNGGGIVKSTEKMGRRKLAYMVRRFNEGNYILLTIEADGTQVKELERRLRVTEPVIKFITVQLQLQFPFRPQLPLPIPLLFRLQSRQKLRFRLRRRNQLRPAPSCKTNISLAAKSC